MNRDELAALEALTRSLGWQILCREFGRRRESTVALMLNPDTPLDVVHDRRCVEHGISEVLGWPSRVLDAEAMMHEQEIVRAGVQRPPEEDE